MQATGLQEGQEVRGLGKDAIPEAPVQRDNPDKNLVEQFVQELSRLSGQVYRVSADMLSKKIIEFLNARGTNRVQMWEEVPGLDRSVLTSKGIQVQTDSDATFEAGIFGVLAAVAKTGT